MQVFGLVGMICLVELRNLGKVCIVRDMNIVDILLKSSGIEPTTTYTVTELSQAKGFYNATTTHVIDGQDTHTGLPVTIFMHKLFHGTRATAEESFIVHNNKRTFLTVEELRKYI